LYLQKLNEEKRNNAEVNTPMMIDHGRRMKLKSERLPVPIDLSRRKILAHDNTAARLT
jgi:hypothetical protein